MYEADHVVKIIRLGHQLQHEMAPSTTPDRDTIAAICQEIENSAHIVYCFARGIEPEASNG